MSYFHCVLTLFFFIVLIFVLILTFIFLVVLQVITKMMFKKMSCYKYNSHLEFLFVKKLWVNRELWAWWLGVFCNKINSQLWIKWKIKLICKLIIEASKWRSTGKELNTISSLQLLLQHLVRSSMQGGNLPLVFCNLMSLKIGRASCRERV